MKIWKAVYALSAADVVQNILLDEDLSAQKKENVTLDPLIMADPQP